MPRFYPAGVGKRTADARPASSRRDVRKHPSEYYTAGKERDGEWFNPAGLFGLKDGGAIDFKHFLRLYNGFGPEDRAKLTQTPAASSARRAST